jgi:hypothetical protein
VTRLKHFGKSFALIYSEKSELIEVIKAFIITEQEDAFYFENSSCVITVLPVDPYGLVIYKTKLKFTSVNVFV